MEYWSVHRGHVAAGQVLDRGHGAVVDVTGPGRGLVSMMSERSHADVRGPSRPALGSARALGVGALSRPTYTSTGSATADKPVTVQLDRSGTPGRGCANGRGRTAVSACLRPSRPMPSQCTRLASLPAAGRHDQRAVRHLQSKTGSSDWSSPFSDPLHRPSPHDGRDATDHGENDRVARQSPGERASPAAGPPPNMPPRLEASRSSPIASAATAPVTPRPAPSDPRATIAPGVGGDRSVSSLTPRRRCHSMTAAATAPSGMASGSRGAAGREGRGRRSMLAAAQSPPMTRTPARPVTALRHALWRRRLRTTRSSSCTGRARDRPSPTGTAAALTKRSAGRTLVRPLADAHAETTEVSASCVATVAAYERAVTTPVTHRLVGQRARAQGAHERLRRRGGRHEQGGLLGMPVQHCTGGPTDGRCLLAGPARRERRRPRPHTERAPTGHLRPSRLPTRSVRVRHRRPWPVSCRDGAVASFPGGDPFDPTGRGRRGRNRQAEAGLGAATPSAVDDAHDGRWRHR